MAYLIGVTCLWAFSFSLIGVYLAGQVDGWFSVLTRTALAALVFAPMLKPKSVPMKTALKLMSIGAIQLGLMYCFYYQSFLYLSVPEVLLFTVMTPVYVTLFSDAAERKFNPSFFLYAAIAVLGAVAIRYNGIDSGFLFGFFLVQMANLCFAIGQVSYKRLISTQVQSLSQSTVFGWFFLGALLVAIVAFALFGNPEKLPTTGLQWGILIYLGTVASGLGYFFWNKGATIVNVGALAVANNLLIPAGILVNVVIWNRDADLFRLAIGAAIIVSSLLLNQWQVKKRSPLAKTA
ncbi:DMT family transporter [Reinekea marinisedimentorum]|uniref:Carboxylate/amino acid/amine transporter n=1 Tax=Reinekea marinisedimentorum TaxID=230495 RepID=A0A4R3I1H1_9GAMM|nr:DMT family transporter [Reinekea marinisedimentorum]TCS38853.1 carboxylate/amino acid/amine transporter [Reinekea marinisedimentorum]